MIVIVGAIRVADMDVLASVVVQGVATLDFRIISPKLPDRSGNFRSWHHESHNNAGATIWHVTEQGAMPVPQ